MRLTALVAFTIGTLLLAAPGQAAQSLAGRATVVDGDTIAIEGIDTRFRLYGIDAPEGKQTCDDAMGKRYLCGSRSAEYLAGLIGRSGRVSCVEEDRDRYGRVVAECSTVSGTNLNREMVRAGWAIEYSQYSDGRYTSAQAEAKAAKRGLWAGGFLEPSEFRRLERGPGAPTGSGKLKAAPSSAWSGEEGRPVCAIKGNVSKSGRIYHSPGQADYAKTQINEAKGERWFCSASEAEAAGWRAAKR